MRRLVVGLSILTMAALALSWVQADDQQIVQQITQRLKQEQDRGNLRGFDIDLKVARGEVLLRGRVASPEQQRLALQVAEKTEGVQRVINDLRIDSPAGGDRRSVA